MDLQFRVSRVAWVGFRVMDKVRVSVRDGLLVLGLAMVLELRSTFYFLSH